jgi:hypothetical protein
MSEYFPIACTFAMARIRSRRARAREGGPVAHLAEGATTYNGLTQNANVSDLAIS